MKGGGLLTKKRQKSKKEKDISVERKSRGLGRGRRRDHLLALVAGEEGVTEATSPSKVGVVSWPPSMKLGSGGAEGRRLSQGFSTILGS